MSATDQTLALGSLTPLHWLGIAMALVSAVVHLVLGIGFLPHYMGVLFLLATGGFVGAVVLVLIDYRRRLIYLVGIPFTLVQVVAWYQVVQPDSPGALGTADVIDKVAQVILIAVLILLSVRES